MYKNSADPDNLAYLHHTEYGVFYQALSVPLAFQTSIHSQPPEHSYGDGIRHVPVNFAWSQVQVD